MKKVHLLLYCICIFASTSLKAQSDEQDIKGTIVNFLNWHAKPKNDAVNKHYVIVGYIPVNKTMVRQVLDKSGVEKYLAFYKRSGFFSDVFINNLRGHFFKVGKYLEKSPLLPKGELIKIPGLDEDYILQTDEPDLMLDYISHGIIRKFVILGNKAIIQFYITDNKFIRIFTMSKINGKWFIDGIEGDQQLSDELYKNN